MKALRSRIALLALATAGLAGAVAFSGCSKSDRTEATTAVKDTYEDTKTAIAKGWTDVKDFTFEKRNDFTAAAKSASARLDVEVSRVRANYSDAQASASRKAAMEELKNSEANYKEKLAALGDATSATWDSAKKNTTLAWDRLEAAYYKARAN